VVTGGYHDPSTAPNALRNRRRNYLRRKPSLSRFRFSLFDRAGPCPFDPLGARTGRRAAGSATRKSSSPHYGGNQRIDFRELSAADFEAFWRVRALSMPISNGLGDAAKGVAAANTYQSHNMETK
jgi:hypothetical protein